MLSPVFTSLDSAKSAFKGGRDEILTAWAELIRCVSSGATNYSTLHQEALSNIERLELAYRITDRIEGVNLNDSVTSLFDESLESKEKDKLIIFLTSNGYNTIRDLAKIPLTEFETEFPELTAKQKLMIRYMLFKQYDVVLPSPHAVKTRELAQIRFSTQHAAESLLEARKDGLDKYLTRSLFNSFINLAYSHPEPFSLLVNPKFLKELLKRDIIMLADFFAMHPRKLEEITNDAFPRDPQRAHSTFNAAQNLSRYVREHYLIPKEVDLREKSEQLKEKLAKK